jgi:hypothetical protein
LGLLVLLWISSGTEKERAANHMRGGRSLPLYDNLGPQWLVEWSGAKHDEKKLMEWSWEVEQIS